MAEVATAGVEKSLDDFFAKRDKKKKKEKGKGKEAGPVSAPASVKKIKKEKEKSTKNENQDATIEKVAICVAKLNTSGVVATLKLALSRDTLTELVASLLASMLCYVTRFRVKANKLTGLYQELDLCAHGGQRVPRRSTCPRQLGLVY